MQKLFLFALMIVCAMVPVSCLTTLQPLVTEANIIQDNRIRGNWQSDKGPVTIETLPNTNMLDRGDSSTMAWVLASHNQSNSFRKYDVLFIDKGRKQFMTNTTSFDTKKGVNGKFETNESKTDSINFSKHYTLSFEHKSKRHVMDAALTRVGDDLFIQLQPLAINDRESDGSGYELTYDYHPSFTIGKITSIGNNNLTIAFLNGDYIKQLIEKGQVRIKHEKDILFNSFVITASSAELKSFLEKYGDDERLYSTDNTISLTRKG